MMMNKWYEPRDARIQAVEFKMSEWQPSLDGGAPAWLRTACSEGVVRFTMNDAGEPDGTLTISNPFLGDHICEEGWFICRAHDSTICACAPEGFALGYVEVPSTPPTEQPTAPDAQGAEF